jgi:uncharacterized protein
VSARRRPEPQPGDRSSRVRDRNDEVSQLVTQPVPNRIEPGTGLGPRILLTPIIAYRRWVSPALPDRCRFYPSCSAYAMTAISTHGPVRGLGLAIWRLLRCHPFHPGGYDPVPPPRDSHRHHGHRLPGHGQPDHRLTDRQSDRRIDDVTGAVS